MSGDEALQVSAMNGFVWECERAYGESVDKKCTGYAHLRGNLQPGSGLESPAACGNGDKCLGYILTHGKLVFAIMHRCETCRANGREHPTFICALCTAASCTVEGSTHACCNQCIEEGTEAGFMRGPVDPKAVSGLMHFIFTDEKRCREFISLTFLWRMMMCDKRRNLGVFCARMRTGKLQRVFDSVMLTMVQPGEELGGSSTHYSADDDEMEAFLLNFFPVDEVAVLDEDPFVRDTYASMDSPAREEVPIEELEEQRLRDTVVAFIRSGQRKVTLEGDDGFTHTLTMLDTGVVLHATPLFGSSYRDAKTGERLPAFPGAVEGEDPLVTSMRIFVASGRGYLLLDDDWGFEASFTRRSTEDGRPVVQHFCSFFDEGASTFYDAMTLQRLPDGIEASLLCNGPVKRKAESFPVDNDWDPMPSQQFRRLVGSEVMPLNV